MSDSCVMHTSGCSLSMFTSSVLPERLLPTMNTGFGCDKSLFRSLTT